jgi:tungstate transport system substrate-binding protein
MALIRGILLAWSLFGLTALPAAAQQNFITVASTTSTEQSGLFKHLLPLFEKKIAAAGAPFASRGDKSGTHAAELRLWKAAGIDPAGGKGGWYRETGSGMGPTLNTASAMNACAFTDRGTWLSFKNRGELVIVVEGDQRLFNQYGIMLVNPAKHPHVKKDPGQAFIDWVVSAEGQAAIAAYKIGADQCFSPTLGAEIATLRYPPVII